MCAVAARNYVLPNESPHNRRIFEFRSRPKIALSFVKAAQMHAFAAPFANFRWPIAIVAGIFALGGALAQPFAHPRWPAPSAAPPAALPLSERPRSDNLKHDPIILHVTPASASTGNGAEGKIETSPFAESLASEAATGTADAQSMSESFDRPYRVLPPQGATETASRHNEKNLLR